MDGINSDIFIYFKVLMLKGFIELRKHMDSFIQIIKIMMERFKFNMFQFF